MTDTNLGRNEAMLMNKLQYLWLDRRYLVSGRRESLIRWIAWHLPRELVMWCYYCVGAHATTGKYGNTDGSELGMMDAIKRWDESDANEVLITNRLS